jgi:hypothetical protein
VEDENGNIVRETMKDNDVLAQYKVGRGCMWSQAYTVVGLFGLVNHCGLSL